MTAIVEAGLDHAVMAEDLLTQAARQFELAADALAKIDERVAVLPDDSLDDDADLIEYRRIVNRATGTYGRLIQAAQVHATLASAPQYLDALVVESEVGEVQRTADVRQGDRVCFVHAAGESGRPFPIIMSDSLGTVKTIGPEADPEALVDFDDIGQQRVRIANLRVVLGA